MHGLEDIWTEEISKQKLKKFDETLRSLRRQFKRLLKENKKSRDSRDSIESINLSRQNSSTPKKNNGSSGWSKAASELISESRKVVDQVPIEDDNNPAEKKILLTSNPERSKKSEKTFSDDEIPEIHSEDFEFDLEQSSLDQPERTKSSSNLSENQLQKSPVFCKNRIKAKKSQSPRVDVTSYKTSHNIDKKGAKIIEDEPVTEFQKSEHDDVKSPLNTTKSLFSSVKENESQIFASPQLNPCQKLGITKLYNVNTKLLSNGNKLKQTKLIFTVEEEKTDISNASNFSNQATSGVCDSIFDSTLFSRDAGIENMDVDMENSISCTKSTVHTKKNWSSSEKKRVLDTDDFCKISPITENRKLKLRKQINISKKGWKISRSPKRIKIDFSKGITSRSDINFFVPQACSTQISLPKKEDKSNVGMIQDLSSDTDLSFNEEYTSKKQFSNSAKILTDVWKKSPPSKQKSDKNAEDDHNQENQAQSTEVVLDDETFFSPGEYQNDRCIGENLEPSTSEITVKTSPKARRVLMNSFDRIPEKKQRSPDYAYVVQSVRRKSERAQLNGWACWDCKKYYQGLELSEKELKECMKKCSRHKAKFDPEYHTPPDFWNPVFPDTFAPTLRGSENN